MHFFLGDIFMIGQRDHGPSVLMQFEDDGQIDGRTDRVVRNLGYLTCSNSCYLILQKVFRRGNPEARRKSKGEYTLLNKRVLISEPESTNSHNFHDLPLRSNTV